MKIDVTSKIVKFKKLERGDTFIFNEEVYLKTDGDNENNAVNLAEGILQDFNEYDDVEPVKLVARRLEE